MTFINVTFHLVIRKSLKNFLRTILQWQSDVINAATSTVNDVIMNIAGKVYIINDQK